MEVPNELSISWHSYPSIHNLGHRYVKDLLTVPVNVEEKVDGSQFSFGIFPETADLYPAYGGLRVRSKGSELHVGAPETMFIQAVDAVKAIAPLLHPGWTYRGEYLRKPKHNTLPYDRIPRSHVILFDINDGHESYLPYEQKAEEAERLGMDVVPLLFTGMLTEIGTIRGLLDRQSILGGAKIEGVVIKPRGYDMWGQDKKVLMGKFVSEAFKESHGAEWKKTNPTRGDVIYELAGAYKSPARWEKAIQHLREAGKLTESLVDIGTLMREVPADIEKECVDEIKEALFKWAWPQIRRASTAGLPEWYKERLLAMQFEKEREDAVGTD